MKIRIAASDDIDLLVQLRMDYLNSDDPAVRSTLRDYFVRSLTDGSFFAVIVEEGGEEVSAAFLSIAEHPPRGAFRNIIGTVFSVFTYPPHRGKGYARAAMEALIIEARRRGVTTVELLSSPDGERLYQSLGFTAPKYAAMRIKL